VALHAAIERTAAANAMLFVNAQPIYVVVGSWLLFGTRVTRRFGVGVAVALVGAVLVAWQSLDIGTDHLIGDGLAVIAGLGYAGYILAASRLRGRLSSAEINLWTCLLAVPILVLVTLAGGYSLIPESPRGWGLMIALGVISQGLGQGLIVWGLAHLPTSFSSVALLTAPVAAGVFAWLFLDESLVVLQIIGMGAVLVGIYVSWRAAPIASKKKPL
jgi:drug/metabolite transporter (DMT)-like permease